MIVQVITPKNEDLEQIEFIAKVKSYRYKNFNGNNYLSLEPESPSEFASVVNKLKFVDNRLYNLSSSGDEILLQNALVIYVQ